MFIPSLFEFYKTEALHHLCAVLSLKLFELFRCRFVLKFAREFNANPIPGWYHHHPSPVGP